MTLSLSVEMSGKTEMNKESNLARGGNKKKGKKKNNNYILLNSSYNFLSFLKIHEVLEKGLDHQSSKLMFKPHAQQLPFYIMFPIC